MNAPVKLEMYSLDPHQWRSFVFMMGLPRLGRLIGVLLILAAVLYFQDPSFGGPMVLGVAVAGLFLLGILWANCNSSIKNPLNRFGWASRQVEFDEVMIRVATSEGSRSELPWRTIVKATATKDFYLLYVTATQYLPIPRTAFKDPSQEAELRAILKGLSLIREKPAKK